MYIWLIHILPIFYPLLDFYPYFYGSNMDFNSYFTHVKNHSLNPLKYGWVGRVTKILAHFVGTSHKLCMLSFGEYFEFKILYGLILCGTSTVRTKYQHQFKGREIHNFGNLCYKIGSILKSIYGGNLRVDVYLFGMIIRINQVNCII